MYQGDFLAASSVVFNFNTAAFSDGSPITLAGTPAISVYKNSTTESTAGVTLTVDYDARTGMHHVVIDTSADGTFYAAGNDFDVVLTAGTVGGTSVVGRKVGSFSLENRTQKADVRKWNGTTVATPATAGIPDVNAKNINNVPTTSVTTVNPNLGTTQPINFTGTGASALAKSDMVDIAGAAVSTTVAQVGVNVVNAGGAAWASAILSGIGMATANLDIQLAALDADVLSRLAASAYTAQTGDSYAALTAATTEPTTPPASTASIVDKIRWLFCLGKNKRTQTSTTELVRNDADNATIGTATKSDDGVTYIRGKYS